jgi:hypothetical protein
MGLRIKLLAFCIGLLFSYFVLRSIRRNSMRPAHAVLWIGISAFLLSISVLEPFYRWVATSIIGIVDARHVIYIVLIGFLLIYVFHLTQTISSMADRIQVLVSQLSIVEAQLDRAAAARLPDAVPPASREHSMPSP